MPPDEAQKVASVNISSSLSFYSVREEKQPGTPWLLLKYTLENFYGCT